MYIPKRLYVFVWHVTAFLGNTIKSRMLTDNIYIFTIPMKCTYKNTLPRPTDLGQQTLSNFRLNDTTVT